MPFNPALPANNSRVSSSELRDQFTGLKDYVDDVASDLNMNITDVVTHVFAPVRFCRPFGTNPARSGIIVENDGPAFSFFVFRPAHSTVAVHSIQNG